MQAKGSTDCTIGGSAGESTVTSAEIALRPDFEAANPLRPTLPSLTLDSRSQRGQFRLMGLTLCGLLEYTKNVSLCLVLARIVCHKTGFQILAVDHLLNQVKRHIVVMIRGLVA